MSSQVLQLLLEILRRLDLLLRHFGIADSAAALPGEFVCLDPRLPVWERFRGSYLECLHYQAQHPAQKIFPVGEAEIMRNLYEVSNGQDYDPEYKAMLRENKLVDRELKRRQRVRRRRRSLRH